MFATFNETIRYLYSIPADFPTHGAFKYARGRHFARICGDIQNSFPSIHIAGTSGKGSTAWITHHILLAHGYRSGLHISPHTLDYRERLMTSDKFMDEATFVDHVNSFLPSLETMTASAYGRPSYTEVSTMLAFHAFARENREVAVIEVGCGGLHDASNILDREDTIRIITEIGYDHTQWLGGTLREIMYQKAGIIHTGNRVISFRKSEEIQPLLSLIAETEWASAYFPEADDVLTVREVSSGEVRFDIHDDRTVERDIVLGMTGAHQARNAYLALRAVDEWIGRQWRKIDYGIVRATLATLRMPARFDRIIMNENTTLVIDGAHNPQKMQAFMRSVREAYPDTRIEAILGFKEGKDYPEMLEYVLPEVASVAVSSFDIGTNSIRSENLPDIVNIARSMTDVPVRAVVDMREELVDLRQKPTQKRVVIATGSLYFASTLYPLLRDMGISVGGQ